MLVAHAMCDYSCEVQISDGRPYFVITRREPRAAAAAAPMAVPPLAFKGRTPQEAWSALQASPRPSTARPYV